MLCSDWGSMDDKGDWKVGRRWTSGLFDVGGFLKLK